MGKFVDLLGKKFGRLTVIENNGVNKKGGYTWKCSCECGKEHIVRSDMLKNGDVKSCGCLHSPNDTEYLERIKQKLLAKSHKVDDCLVWNGNSKHTFGYGWINIRKKYIGAHRASWLVFKGKIPLNMCVCHICDNPSCINPEHLFLGTSSDNCKDRVKKGRSK
jgi:hypothetical protein